MLLSAALLVLELLALSGLALALHAARWRYGLAPLLMYMAGLVGVSHALGPVPVTVDLAGTVVVVAEVTVVPTILLALLLVYTADGTAAARIAIGGILAVSVVVLAVQLARQMHLALPGGETGGGFPTRGAALQGSWRTTLSSMAAFFTSLVVIAVAHQGITNRLGRLPVWASPGVALLVALWADDAVFRLGTEGGPAYLSAFPGGLPAKTAAALLLWPILATYMTRARVMSPRGAGADRSTWDILLGSYRHTEEWLRMTQARRREAEEQLQAVIDHAPIILFGTDAQGRFTLSAGAGLKGLGLRPGEVVGRSAFELFPEVADRLSRALAGERFTDTVQVEDRWYDVTYIPVDGGDAVAGMIGIAMDVSQRRRAERSEKQSEALFRATFEHAAVGMMHADPEGRILRMNPVMAELLGYDSGHLPEDLHLSEITHADEIDGLSARIQDLLSGASDRLEIDSRFLRADGVSFWGHCTVSLVRGETDRPDYLVIVVEDLTERRATEAQLRQAQKMETVGQLTGGVAHDFNNLLTVILGNLEFVLAENVEPGERRAMLEQAMEAAKRGAQLTQRLLAFSRRQALRPVAIDLRGLLADMRRLLTRVLDETIHVEVEIEDGVPPCRADRGQMETAILNLALNARDAMPAGGTLKLSARAWRADEETSGDLTVQEIYDERPPASGRYVEVAVVDDGEGMEPERAEHIFEPFFTTKEVGKGSGLGLSQVYGFVRQSGGFVRIRTAPGEGTAVRMILPAWEGDT